MNPDNNALNRTFFIGGPPRVGKTILAYKLADRIKGHVVTTDAIRNALKKANKNHEGDLFIINRHENVPDEEWIASHQDKPGAITNIQNVESKTIWPSVVGFASAFCEDNQNHIVEGVAILPELVAKMKNKPKNIIFVGNTSSEHWKTMLKHAKDNPQLDWMKAMGYSEQRIKAMGSFVRNMSQYFKDEALKYGFNYFEIDDGEFDKSIDAIITKLLD